MQQGDQSVLSLRPGGGRGGSRLFAPRTTLSSSSDLTNGGDAPSFPRGDSRFEGREILRFTREQLLQLKEAIQVSDEILKLSQEIASDLFGEEQSWGRSESKPAVQPQNRFLETDNRDWHTRAPIPSPSKERSREDQREPRDAHTGSNQWSGPAPSLVKAEVPWSARRGTLSEKDQVLKTVKGILNKMTPEKYDLLKDTALLTNTHYSCKSVVSRTGPRILQSIGSSSFRSLSCHRFPPSLCLGGSEVDEPQSRLMNGSYSRSGLGFSRSPSQVEGKRSWFSALNHCLTPGGSAC